MTFEDLQRVNGTISKMDVKGKAYALVNERIKAFRMLYPEGAIETDLVCDAEGRCVFKATIKDDNGKVLGTGTAYEIESSSYINKTSYIENCETSAVGRALAMCGIGIDTSIASAEEVSTAIARQEAMKTLHDNCSNKKCGKEISHEQAVKTTLAYGRALCEDCEKKAIAYNEEQKAKGLPVFGVKNEG